MRKLFLFLIALNFIGFVNAQHEQDSAWLRDNYIKKEVTIPMRDGIKLFTAMYVPKDATEKHPVLLLRSPLLLLALWRK